MSRPSKKAEAKSSKSGRAQVNVRTTPQLLAQIDQARQDTSRSEFIVQAIEAYLGIEPPSPQTTATVQSLVDAAVEQAILGVTRTLEERLKALEIRLSASDVDENVDAPVDGLDAPGDSGDAPVDEVARVDVDGQVDSLVDSGDAPVEGEIQATSAELELEEVTVRDRHASPESERFVEAAGDSGDDAVEGEVQATSGELGLEEATGGDLSRSQESKQGVDAAGDFRTQGLSGRELAKRLSVSPSSITTNRKKKGTNAFAKWTSQQDPEEIAWSYQKERYYPVEPKG
ncbi:hypothetical protein [Oxynema aestuarii]|jgi:hypothetical protein|uniref:Uncharacterized protein n=1 Tax=Oxynema aestuarii AP17 TaxID=2064643 RepID=A0A6H1U3K9_9CYAN|nr:hypothetical protein [Oxynema aestuarii]QIZ73016.1 hypothetical protein HCG48_22415 [Oxynema aestuarii AP17]